MKISRIQFFIVHSEAGAELEGDVQRHEGERRWPLASDGGTASDRQPVQSQDRHADGRELPRGGGLRARRLRLASGSELLPRAVPDRRGSKRNADTDQRNDRRPSDAC